MPKEAVNIAKTSSLKRVRSAVVKLQIAKNSMTDVYTDTEYSVTMLAVLAEHRGFVIRKMPLKFGTGGLKMANRFNALCGQEESDHKFLVEIIAQICDYAVDNDMKPNDTIMVIANNMLMLTEIANYDNWKRRAENDD